MARRRTDADGERHDEGDVARERGVKIRVKRRWRKGSSWGRERKGGREGGRKAESEERDKRAAGRKKEGRKKGRVDSLVAWMDKLSVEE